MRRHDKEIKDRKVIDSILENAGICRLGLVDNGEAYIVPVNYAYKEGTIYIHSAPHGRKMDIIRMNKFVSFEITGSEEIIVNEVPCEWSAKYRSVMGTGIITIENNPDLKKAGMDLIMMKYGAKGELSYDEGSFSRMVLLKLRINAVTGKQSGDW
jgi:nitroimidazol reductase NimA-like FMN-containing flavoprotein (pyridoxamine 5'-phosphate oxidase superfamily)